MAVKDKYLQIRLPQELKEAAQEAADSRHENLSELIRGFLWEYLERVEREREEG